MKIKKFSIAFLAASSLLLSACSSNYSEPDVQTTIENGGAYSETLSKKGQENIDDSKLLSNYKIKIDSKNIEEASNEIKKKTHSEGGYISFNTSDDKNKSKKKVNLSVKIPTQNSKNIINYLENNYYISSKELDSVDVSSEYTNLEDQIKNIEKREERLNKIYNNTIVVKDVFSLDEKLSKLSTEKNELKKSLEKIDDRLKYFKINIELNQVSTLPTDKSDVADSFSKSMSSISSVFSTIGSLIGKAFPVFFYMLLIACVLSGGYTIMRFSKAKISKNRKDKKEKSKDTDDEKSSKDEKDTN